MSLSVRQVAVGALAFVIAACTAVQAPITGRTQYMAVPEETVVNAGAESYAKDVRKYGKEGHLNADPAETARVRQLAARIIQQTKAIRPEAASWKWNVSVADYGTVNAYCYPGGKIVVYSGLIRKLKLTDDELAAVLAHEVSHALAQHQREAISEKMTEQLILGVLDVALVAASKGGKRYDPHTISTLTAQVSTLMFTLPYSREREYEADRIGLTLMSRAGFDPHAMETAFQKMAALSPGGPSFLSTHPSGAERIVAIQTAIRTDPELSNRQLAFASAASEATGADFPPSGPTSSAHARKAGAHQSANRYQVLKGNGPEVARRFEETARNGDANASLALGLMELRGAGIPVNKEAAARHIEDAAALGHPVAMNEIGNLYAAGNGVPRDDAKALSWYQKSADLGVLMAKTNLGFVHYIGRGVPVDQAKAASLLEAPAAAGVPVAQRLLGRMYVEGKGVPVDVPKGWNLLQRAAAKDRVAQAYLGVHLVKGTVVPKNIAEGVAYLEQAAESGQVVAMRLLGELYAKGSVVPQYADKAVAYLERAGASNDAISLRVLGILYVAGEAVPDLPYGKLIPPDPKKGFAYLKRAADLGDESARYILGALYHRGLGVEKNDALAELNIRMSAERGYAPAQYVVGVAFARGVIFEKDEDEAVRWLKMAAAQNHQKAKDELRQRGIDLPAVAPKETQE